MRYCNGCEKKAWMIGSYTRNNGERCTVAACSENCRGRIHHGPAHRDQKITWATMDGQHLDTPPAPPIAMLGRMPWAEGAQGAPA